MPQEEPMSLPVVADDSSKAVAAWQGNTVYEGEDTVYHQHDQYACLLPHCSTSDFSADLASGYWVKILANPAGS
jgi:hypothetical protein